MLVIKVSKACQGTKEYQETKGQLVTRDYRDYQVMMVKRELKVQNYTDSV
jgi:hypothetical protein